MFNYFIKDYFLKSISILINGSFVAQFITIIIAPLMTRLFSATDIGLYTYLTTISYMFLPIISGRYELAIVTEEYKRKIFVLVKICISISIILTVFIGIFYLIYWIDTDKYEYLKFLPFIIIHIFINGYINIVTSWNNRFQQYFLITAASVKRNLSLLFLTIFFGNFCPNIYGLLMSAIFSCLVSLHSQSKDLIKYINNILFIPRKDIVTILTKYKSFLIYSVPSAFINNFSYIAINFCIEELYGLQVLAYYAISFRVLGVPLSLISNNIGKIYFEQSSREYYSTGGFYRTFYKTFFILSVLAAPIGFILYFFSPLICDIFFGDEWRIAGEYIQIMTLMFVVRFIVSPLTVSVLVTKNNRFELCGQILFLANIFITYCLSTINKYTIIEFLTLYSNLNIISYVIWILIIFYLAKGGFDVTKEVKKYY